MSCLQTLEANIGILNYEHHILDISAFVDPGTLLMWLYLCLQKFTFYVACVH